MEFKEKEVMMDTQDQLDQKDQKDLLDPLAPRDQMAQKDQWENHLKIQQIPTQLMTTDTIYLLKAIILMFEQ